MSDRSQDAESPRSAVVVPIRSFSGSKQRLATVMDEQERRALTERLAATALAACRHHLTAVVTSDTEVARLASEHGAIVIADPGSLDDAANAGRAWARTQQVARIVVLHADLPFVDRIDVLTDPGHARIAVIVPDQRSDGTPALSVPVDSAFEFAYGPGSFARHLSSAEAAGLSVRIMRDAGLGFDVDLPEDLTAMHAREQHR
jgi:2-phospho-L-lactate guanylyltransferase